MLVQHFLSFLVQMMTEARLPSAPAVLFCGTQQVDYKQQMTLYLLLLIESQWENYLLAGCHSMSVCLSLSLVLFYIWCCFILFVVFYVIPLCLQLFFIAAAYPYSLSLCLLSFIGSFFLRISCFSTKRSSSCP